MANDTIISGIDAIRKRRAEVAKQREEREREPAKWFSIKGREKGVPVKFLQELDKSSPAYDESRGLAIVVVEHQAPGQQGFRSRGLCTADSEEGRCFPCERNQLPDERGQWKPKTNLYVNVLDGEDGEVKILSTNFNGGFAASLIDFWEENDAIVNTQFKISKQGDKTQPWSLVESKKTVIDDSGVQIWNLQDYAVRHIAYDKQEEYYMRNAEVARPKVAEEQTDEEW